MDIWLKKVSIEDNDIYCDLLIELATYKDVYARPVPSDFGKDEFELFKKARVSMETREKTPVNTYWIMDSEIPVGYATLRRNIDINKPGGNLGCCLKKEYQNKGLGTIVSDLLSEIAYNDYGIEKLMYTAKNENKQSQRSIEKIGGKLIEIHDGYHFYVVDLRNKYEKGRLI